MYECADLAVQILFANDTGGGRASVESAKLPVFIMRIIGQHIFVLARHRAPMHPLHHVAVIAHNFDVREITWRCFGSALLFRSLLQRGVISW
jgi:hypothetical protein